MSEKDEDQDILVEEKNEKDGPYLKQDAETVKKDGEMQSDYVTDLKPDAETVEKDGEMQSDDAAGLKPDAETEEKDGEKQSDNATDLKPDVETKEKDGEMLSDDATGLKQDAEEKDGEIQSDGATGLKHDVEMEEKDGEKLSDNATDLKPDAETEEKDGEMQSDSATGLKHDAETEEKDGEMQSNNATDVETSEQCSKNTVICVNENVSSCLNKESSFIDGSQPTLNDLDLKCDKVIESQREATTEDEDNNAKVDDSELRKNTKVSPVDKNMSGKASEGKSSHKSCIKTGDSQEIIDDSMTSIHVNNEKVDNCENTELTSEIPQNCDDMSSFDKRTCSKTDDVADVLELDDEDEMKTDQHSNDVDDKPEQSNAQIYDSDNENNSQGTCTAISHESICETETDCKISGGVTDVCSGVDNQTDNSEISDQTMQNNVNNEQVDHSISDCSQRDGGCFNEVSLEDDHSGRPLECNATEEITLISNDSGSGNNPSNNECSENHNFKDDPSNESHCNDPSLTNHSIPQIDVANTTEDVVEINSNHGNHAIRSSDSVEEELLSELESELDTKHSSQSQDQLSNGLVPSAVASIPNLPEIQKLRTELSALKQENINMKTRMEGLKEENTELLKKLNDSAEENKNYKAQLESASNVNAEDAYIAQTKELEFTIAKLQKELKSVKDKLTSHDGAAKRAVATLQNELKTRGEQSAKMYNECKKEKEMMVIKYAQAEQKNIEVKERHDKMEMRLREAVKEKEIVIARCKAIQAEKMKADVSIEAKTTNMAAIHRELEKYKETVSSMEMKTQWAQNKLKAELEAHKESKLKLEETLRRLKESKDESLHVYKECAVIIRSYQESQETEQKLRKRENQTLPEKSDQEELHVMIRQQLNTLKNKHKEVLEELNTWRDKIKCLEQERINQEETLNKFRETLQNQKRDNRDQQQRLEELIAVEKNLNNEQETAKALVERIEELEQSNVDLVHDMEACRKQETEHLAFTEKISDKNVQLQSEKTALQKQVEEQTKLGQQHEEMLRESKSKNMELTSTKVKLEEENATLLRKLQDKTKTVEELTVQVEDGKDENKTLKRRHAANVKDLTRQLQQIKVKLDRQDGSNADKDSISMCSRTSSNGSLDTMSGSGGGVNSAPHGVNHSQPASKPSSMEAPPPPQPPPPPQDDYSPIVEVIEIDKNKLLEKIVKLQKTLARKNEKIEFMEDHTHQMLDEIKKKSRIIQTYVLREESGLMTSEKMDLNKAQLQKKGGIMASVYGSHAMDGAMNMDLSLQINRKLQAVLEDTILKNITLKESLDTLGKEISRLSQENRKLQLDLQSCTKC